MPGATLASKIFQPEATTLSLLLHHRQLGKGRLILSANPRLPRVHLTTTKAENPLTPPMFCMLLRKHLEGAKLLKVEQLGLERVLTLNISGKDELGNLVTYRLIAEIMGRYSNIALVTDNSDRLYHPGATSYEQYTYHVTRDQLPIPASPGAD